MSTYPTRTSCGLDQDILPLAVEFGRYARVRVSIAAIRIDTVSFASRTRGAKLWLLLNSVDLTASTRSSRCGRF